MMNEQFSELFDGLISLHGVEYVGEKVDWDLVPAA